MIVCHLLISFQKQPFLKDPFKNIICAPDQVSESDLCPMSLQSCCADGNIILCVLYSAIIYSYDFR